MERQTAGADAMSERERRIGHRRFQDLLRILEQHNSDHREVGEEMLSELIRRGIRIPSDATTMDLMSLVIDAEAPYLQALEEERRGGERRRV